MFQEDSKSPAMIRHGMDVLKQATDHVNPGKITVFTVDQPLYAIAKTIQWTWPESYGEDKFVVVLGGLHTEMVVLKCLGDWLEKSGWTEVLVEANIATAGVADSYLKASHVTRTRRAHQVTACALYILQHKVYAEYTGSLGFDEWCKEHTNTSPQFQYWSITLQLEILLLLYVRSLREGNFQLYVESIAKIAQWCFALDHTHYARWLPVHVRDMASLQWRLPAIAQQFQMGNFVVHKSMRPFSAMAIDQAHEQNNTLVKGDGGAVGLTENPKALHRWMVAGPETARVIQEFEMSLEKGHKVERKEVPKHHDASKAVQTAFDKDVKALVTAMSNMGNPFVEESGSIVVLDSKDVASTDMVNTVKQVEKIGKDQYDVYVKERLIDKTKSIMDTIKKNNLPLFSQPRKRVVSKAQMKISSLKSNCALFSRLYIGCQSRDGNLEEFFSHENQAYPPSLSQMGELYFGTKSNLAQCLESGVELGSNMPEVDVIILDGAAIINMLAPRNARTFSEYASNVFEPYVLSQLKHTRRVDIVFDQYISDSLKSTTREKRGKGTRRKVTPGGTLPTNWSQFLRVDDNKTELFHFLSKYIVDALSTEENEVVATLGDHVLSNKIHADLSALQPCTHEEGDTRMILHAADAAHTADKILLRTVDTDVLVLAVSFFSEVPVTELWVALGTGKNLKYFPAHDIANTMGPDKSKALRVFHSFTGCDTTSAFRGIGKKRAWDTWSSYVEVTAAFLTLSSKPVVIDNDTMAVLERFVILMYDRTSSEEDVNTVRRELFAKKSRAIEAIPPTQAALHQHVKRVAYQGGHCWGQALISSPNLPSPSEWGWTKVNTTWQPLWTTLPEASKSCNELLHCGCQKGCQKNCKCSKADLKCTELCECGGGCSRN
jgi:hypothetical protein